MFGTIFAGIVALLFSFAGLHCSFKAWQQPGASARLLSLAVAMWFLATYGWCRLLGAEIGIPVALETAAITGLVFILFKSERRPPKPPKNRLLPQEAKARFYRVRGLARFLLAGPVALIAALGVAIIIATKSPLHEQTRLIVSGLLVPSIWAGLMIYTLMARRLIYAMMFLALVSAGGFGYSMMTGA